MKDAQAEAERILGSIGEVSRWRVGELPSGRSR